jgi:hypothetical protein
MARTKNLRRTSPKAKPRKDSRGIRKDKLLTDKELLARIERARKIIAKLQKAGSRDPKRAAKRKRSILLKRSFEGWAKNPNVGDLYDPNRPALAFDWPGFSKRALKKQYRKASKRTSPKAKSRTSPKAKAKSRTSPKAKSRQIKAKRAAEAPRRSGRLAALAPRRSQRLARK